MTPEKSFNLSQPSFLICKAKIVSLKLRGFFCGAVNVVKHFNASQQPRARHKVVLLMTVVLAIIVIMIILL